MVKKQKPFFFQFILLEVIQKIWTGLTTSELTEADVGIRIVFSALILGTSRNPTLKDKLFCLAILGFAHAEATALFALMIAFLILFV